MPADPIILRILGNLIELLNPFASSELSSLSEVNLITSKDPDILKLIREDSGFTNLAVETSEELQKLLKSIDNQGGNNISLLTGNDIPPENLQRIGVQASKVTTELLTIPLRQNQLPIVIDRLSKLLVILMKEIKSE